MSRTSIGGSVGDLPRLRERDVAELLTLWLSGDRPAIAIPLEGEPAEIFRAHAIRDVAKYDKFLWFSLWVTPAVVRPISPSG